MTCRLGRTGRSFARGVPGFFRGLTTLRFIFVFLCLFCDSAVGLQGPVQLGRVSSAETPVSFAPTVGMGFRRVGEATLPASGARRLWLRNILLGFTVSRRPSSLRSAQGHSTFGVGSATPGSGHHWPSCCTAPQLTVGWKLERGTPGLGLSLPRAFLQLVFGPVFYRTSGLCAALCWDACGDACFHPCGRSASHQRDFVSYLQGSDPRRQWHTPGCGRFQS